MTQSSSMNLSSIKCSALEINAHLLHGQLMIRRPNHENLPRFYDSLKRFWITIMLNFGRYEGNLRSIKQLLYQPRLENNRISS